MHNARCMPCSERGYGRPTAKRPHGVRSLLYWAGYGPVPEEGIAFLVTIRQTETVLVMCMETGPRSCHRFYDIAKRLLEEHGIDAIHLVDLGDEASENRTSSLLTGGSHADDNTP